MRQPRPQVSTRPALRPAARQLPRQLRAILANARDAEALQAQLESEAVFQHWLATGRVRRVTLSHRIPYERYVQYLRRRADSIVARYDLASRPAWASLLRQSPGEVDVPQWAGRWSIPEQDLRWALVGSRPWGTQQGAFPLPVGEPATAEHSDVLPVLIERVAAIVERYHIAYEDFAEYVLSGAYTPRQVATALDCCLPAAEELHALALRLQVLDMVELPTMPAASRRAGSPRVAACVSLAADGTLEIRQVHGGLRTCYAVADDLAERCPAGSHEAGLLATVQTLNDWRCTVLQVVRAICRLQTAFVRSGDDADLHPLSAAEVARLIGAHRSVVGRVAREWSVECAHGVRLLASLLRGRGDVLRAAARQHPAWSDAQLAGWLWERHGVRLSRRAVCYHRTRAAGEAACDREES